MIEKEKRKISTEIFTVMSYLLLCVKKMKESYDKAISSDEISFETETELYFYEDMFYQNVYVFFEKLALYIELSLPKEIRRRIKKRKAKKGIRMKILKEFAKIDKELSELIDRVYKECKENGILKKRNDFTHNFLHEERLTEEKINIRAIYEALNSFGNLDDSRLKETENKIEEDFKEEIKRKIKIFIALLKKIKKFAILYSSKLKEEHTHKKKRGLRDEQ